jgi:two-component system, cell cycle response regulator DivK
VSQRILVVEDQPDNRQILRDLLTSADFEVIEAENGETGLTAAADQYPDLILMDMQMPILEGYEATGRLKSDPALHAIPVIAVTSYASSSDVDRRVQLAAMPSSADLLVHVSFWRRFASTWAHR